MEWNQYFQYIPYNDESKIRNFVQFCSTNFIVEQIEFVLRIWKFEVLMEI
jgi:hypothetical protein